MTDHWTRAARTDRWHRLWVYYLQAQTALNPNHPTDAAALKRYETAARQYRTGTDMDRQLWDAATDRTEQTTRHDLVAALDTFNNTARAGSAHMGLTSCDVTDLANQQAIVESLDNLIGQVQNVAQVLDERMQQHAKLRLVARTHGQPAQVTTYGHRIATVLGPLTEWLRRAHHTLLEYPMRPPYGAVGTAADLQRVLTGWQPDENAPSSTLGGQRSHSDPSSGVPIPPGAPEGSGGAPEGSLMAQIETMIADLGPDHTWRDLAVVLIRDGLAADRAARVPQDVVLTAQSLTDQKCPNGTISDQSTVRGAGDGWSVSGRDLTDGSLIGDTSYRYNETPSVFDSSSSIGADRVTTFTAQIAAKTGFNQVLDTTRQTYHRSIDLNIAALLAELASIAQTWATDRRLESMLGLGTETPSDGQVGSSAMPHKDNPRYSERMCALAVVTRCYLGASAETAGMEWFEGDVSTSAARRIILPGMFDAASRMVADWHRVATSWTVDTWAVAYELAQHRFQLATGAIIQAAVEAGMDRSIAHNAVRVASRGVSERSKMAELVTSPGWPFPARRVKEIIDSVQCEEVGVVQEQIAMVHDTFDRVQGEIV